jgi:hypothetical protein
VIYRRVFPSLLTTWVSRIIYDPWGCFSLEPKVGREGRHESSQIARFAHAFENPALNIL